MDGTGLNPFQQPPIVQALLMQVSRDELVKWRLVSKLWYEESLSTLRSNATLKFNRDGIVSTRDDGSTSTTPLGEFLDLWETGDWGSTPFRKFYLQGWAFDAWDLEQQRFIHLFGSHIISLTLNHCMSGGEDDFRRIIYTAFPKLQFLSMEQCELEDDMDWPKPTEEVLEYIKPAFGVSGLKSLDVFKSYLSPQLIMDLLSHFHNLESLRLEPALTFASYQNLLETIRLVRSHDQTKLPLKEFEVDFEFELGSRTDSSIERLKLHEQLNLPLQRLKFNLFGDMDQNLSLEVVMRSIVQYHHSTLKYLKFDGDDLPYLPTPFPFGFCMNKLEELSIGSHTYSNNLNYLRYTPHLRVLEIANVRGESDELFSNSSQLEIGDWTLSSLRELTFRLTLSPCNLRKLMIWMPYVERLLGFSLDDVKFSMVCKYWKNLKEMDDWGRELTDEGVIGRLVDDEAGGEETWSGPNITQLKNLTSFQTCSSELTSASVHDGFLKLANLKELWLGKDTELDDEAKAALERRKIKLTIELSQNGNDFDSPMYWVL